MFYDRFFSQGQGQHRRCQPPSLRIALLGALSLIVLMFVIGSPMRIAMSGRKDVTALSSEVQPQPLLPVVKPPSPISFGVVKSAEVKPAQSAKPPPPPADPPKEGGPSPLVAQWRALGRPTPLKQGSIYPRAQPVPPKPVEPYCQTRTKGKAVLGKFDKASLPISLQRVLPPRHHNGTTGLKPILIDWQVEEIWVPHTYPKQAAVKCDNHICDMACEIPCQVTWTLRPGEEADALVTNGDWGDPRRPNRIMVAHASEYPEREAHFISRPEKIRNYDLSLSIPTSSDVMLMAHNDKFYTWQQKDGGFYEPRDYSQLYCTPRAKDNSSYLATFISTACNSPSGRENLVKEIAKFISVGRPGACLRNMQFPPNTHTRTYPFALQEYDQKVEFISRYKFYFAFENANFPNWVTEKVFHALTASTVAVYVGTNDIEKWVPPNSVIKYADFESPEELSKYLAYLDTNDEAYSEYFKWKESDFILPARMQASKMFAYCGLCKAVQDLKERRARGEKTGPRIYDQKEAVWKPL